MKRKLGRRLGFLAVLFLFLFNFPLMGLFDGLKGTAVPRSYLLFFLVWGLLVAAIYLVIRSSRSRHE